MYENKVFDRRTIEPSHALISPFLYNFVIGLTLLWGFGLNIIIVESISPYDLLQIGVWPFLIGYFASCFVGIYLFSSSNNPLVSFIGYNFVVIPFGFVVNIVVSQYDPEIVYSALLRTGLVTVLMMCAGTAFPVFFFKISRALTVSLLCVIVVELIGAFFFSWHSSITDWIVVIIFCGYIGYDWARANQIPKTFDNAIDSAAALYMDIINLFLRILRLMGRRS